MKKEKEKEEVLSEEEGEINDGERVKKAFIPRVLCKYYQRGKCSWGRGCKFLHPGVNDTGIIYFKFDLLISTIPKFLIILFYFRKL